jgi:sec-independent protein translocase protein TatA
MFGLGVPELVIILLIIIVLFGWQRLPSIGKSVGQAIKEFQKSIKGK